VDRVQKFWDSERSGFVCAVGGASETSIWITRVSSPKGSSPPHVTCSYLHNDYSEINKVFKSTGIAVKLPLCAPTAEME
jgi:hypothetical protein